MPETKENRLFYIKLRDIVVPPDRIRKTFTRILEMAESIKKYGLIAPIVVSVGKGDKFVLVAGERRYRGSILAGVSRVPVVLRDDADDVLAEIELEENVNRSDISFEEEGIGLEKIQRLKKKSNPDWKLSDTAEMTNRSVGDVSGKIKIAKKFRERPDLKEQCKSLPYTAAIKKIDQIEEAEKVQRLADAGTITLTSKLMHGDCREKIKEIPSDSIDLLLTDPPYGLERLEAIRTSGSKRFAGHSTMTEHHNQSIGAMLELLLELGSELYRVMRPGAHFYMFCGAQYLGDFINSISEWFDFQPPVLVWDRGKPSAPGYGYNYLSRCEFIIYGYRKVSTGSDRKRLQTNRYNLFEFPDVPKNLRRYPTEKPIPLLMELIKNSTITNQVVLDPFAGSASTLVAAKKLGRQSIGIEIDKQAWLRGQQRLANGDDE